MTVWRMAPGVGAKVREGKLRMTPGCQPVSLMVDGGTISVVGTMEAGTVAVQPHLPQELP